MTLNDRLNQVLDRVASGIPEMVDAERYKLRFSADEDSDVVICSLEWREPIPAERRRDFTLDVVRADDGVEIGGFDYDAEDRTLWFRQGLQHASELLSPELIRAMIANAVASSEQFRRTLDGQPAPQDEAADEKDEAQGVALLPTIMAAFASMELVGEHSPEHDAVVTMLRGGAGPESDRVLMVAFDDAREVVYCTIRYVFTIPEPHHPDAAAAICAANCDLAVGKLKMKLEDGSLWFVTALSLAGAQLTEQIVRSMIYVSWESSEDFYDMLYSLSA